MDTSAIQQAFFSGPDALQSLNRPDSAAAQQGNQAVRGIPAQRDTADISTVARNLANDQTNGAAELHLSPEELQRILSDA